MNGYRADVPRPAHQKAIAFLQSKRRLPKKNVLVSSQYLVSLLNGYGTEEAKRLAKAVRLEWAEEESARRREEDDDTTGYLF